MIGDLIAILLPKPITFIPMKDEELQIFYTSIYLVAFVAI